MSFTRPFLALFQGIRLCLFNASVRRHAKWPWLVGVFSYLGTLYGAYRLHGPLVHHFVAEPTGWWRTIVFALAWILAAALLFVASFIVSICLVMVFTSAFQAAIAQAALRAHAGDIELPESSMLAETTRTILVESVKLLWLVPLVILVFFVGLIPPLAPLALVLGAWLLAYQFVDIVLDLFHLSARERLRFGRTYSRSLIFFGLALTLCWAVPFLGVFLAPAATAGAAWLLAEPPYAVTIRELRSTKKQ